MELDEYDDELPPISVNSSKIDESVFAMPSAEVLASQRARAEECERALQQLAEQRERREAEFRAASSTDTVAPSRSNSSGSEGESALLSAVEALRVVSERPVPRAPRVLPVLAPRLPPASRALCDLYCDHDVPDFVTDDIITSIWSWLGGVGSKNPGLDLDGDMEVDCQKLLTDDEVLGVGAWLVWAVTRGVPDARAHRALHALLAAASDDQVCSLAHLLSPLPPLALSRVRRALPPALPRLAPALTRAAIHALLCPGETQPVSLSPLTIPELCSLISLHWRRTPPSVRSLALQVIGSALAGAERASERDERAKESEMLERALAVLAQTGAADKTSPDQLKIAVAASKLKILLSDRI